MSNKFKFELVAAVALALSNEQGIVIGRAEFDDQPPQYKVRYVAADGRQVEDWFVESALVAVGKASKAKPAKEEKAPVKKSKASKKDADDEDDEEEEESDEDDDSEEDDEEEEDDEDEAPKKGKASKPSKKSKKKTDEDDEEDDEADEEESDDEDDAIPYTQVQKVVGKAAKEKGADFVRDTLKKVGGKKCDHASKLKPEQYEAFIEALEEDDE